MDSEQGKHRFGVSSIKLFASTKIHPIVYEDVIIIDGKISYTGNAINGKKNGQGTYIDRSVHVEYKGEWHDDNINGFGTIRNYFDDISFTGNFQNNMMTYGTMNWPNGTKYTGYFTNNQIDGAGIIKWPDQSKYEGTFANGRIEGFGTYTDNKGNIYEKEF